MNISNIATPGYKARIAYQSRASGFGALLTDDALAVADDWRAGNTRSTSNPLDVSIAGEAFFLLSGPDGMLYSRNGQFHKDKDGRLVDGNGLAVQSSGGDILLKGDAPQILTDGTVLDRGEPVARIELFSAKEISKLTRKRAYFTAEANAMQPAQSATLHQGMVETSNVNMASEVLAMMQSQRSAESGQTLVRLYDDLMGRALTAFGQFGS
jgi:flagellar basal body rod protein FlgG